MLFNELFGAGSQATVIVALVSLMGASLSIAFAMAMAIHYLDEHRDEPIASKRQIVLAATVVLIGFYLVMTWPQDDSTQLTNYGDSASKSPSALTTLSLFRPEPAN